MAESNNSVEDYIRARSEPVQAILRELRSLVTSTLPETTEGMMFGAPMYCSADGDPLVYLYGGRDHANLGFLHGSRLRDPAKLLEGRGVSGRHVKIYPGRMPPESALAALLRQCVSAKSGSAHAGRTGGTH